MTVIQMQRAKMGSMISHVAAMKAILAMVIRVKHFQLKTNVHWVTMIAMQMQTVLTLNTAMNVNARVDTKTIHLIQIIFPDENVKPWIVVQNGKSTGTMDLGNLNAHTIQIKLADWEAGCTIAL